MIQTWVQVHIYAVNGKITVNVKNYRLTAKRKSVLVAINLEV